MHKNANGFTLLELMTVMLIMFILMGMATLALRGMVRGTGFSGAVQITRAALTQARQNAIMQGRPTAVVVTRNSMLTLSQFDRVASISPAGELELSNGLPWTERYLQGSRIYNMETGRSQVIIGDEDRTMAMELEGGATANNWRPGVGVGFAAGQRRGLPDGFIFTNIGQTQERVIVFFPTGASNASHTLTVGEEFGGSTTLDIGVEFSGRITLGGE